MALHLFSQNRLLGLITVLKELLQNVIAKNVRHQLQRVRKHFFKHHLLLFAVGRLELLLDKSRTVLIAAKLYNVALNILNQRERERCKRTRQEMHVITTTCL